MSFNSVKTNFNVALAKLFCRLPLSWQLAAGRLFGRLAYYLPNRRRRTAAINLNIAFEQDSQALLKQNLMATGQGVSEMLAALWFEPDGLSGNTLKCFQFKGLQYVRECLQSGQGCLLLSCHTTSIEWGIRALNNQLAALDLPVGHMLARQHNNKDLEAHLEQARLTYVDKLIDKKNIGGLLRSVKRGHPVYYAPDQNFSYQNEFIPFFKRPAATTKGPYLLAQKDIVIIPWFCFRTDNSHWQIDIHPPLNIKQMTEEAALTQINRLFEKQIKAHPEQYLWVHRRFKNQPEGYENLYK